jgi:integrase
MGTAGIKKYQQPHLLPIAAEEWLEMKKTAWSPKIHLIQKTSIKHILPVLGKKLLVDIDARDISQYQESRIAEGASPRTVNIEVSTLRQIMRKHGTWARIQTDVRMLPERQDAGRALTDEEESALLLECGKSRSRILSPFVLLALETGARYNTIRTLQWGNIDFANRCLQFGKDKTPSGTGRIVPLNQRAIESLKFWAHQFPNRLPEHYLFPVEKVGAAGDAFDSKVYDTDPTQPVGTSRKHGKRPRRERSAIARTVRLAP